MFFRSHFMAWNQHFTQMITILKRKALLDWNRIWSRVTRRRACGTQTMGLHRYNTVVKTINYSPGQGSKRQLVVLIHRTQFNNRSAGDLGLALSTPSMHQVNMCELWGVLGTFLMETDTAPLEKTSTIQFLVLLFPICQPIIPTLK